MNFIIWLIIGGLIGWVASMIMRTDGQQGIILNVVVGIVGAFLGGWLLAPMFGTGTINSNDFSLAGTGRVVARRGDPARHRQPVPARQRPLTPAQADRPPASPRNRARQAVPVDPPGRDHQRGEHREQQERAQQPGPLFQLEQQVQHGVEGRDGGAERQARPGAAQHEAP